MRPGVLVIPLILLILQLAFSSSTVCVECEAFADAPAANIVYSLDNIQKTLTVTLFYEDPGGSPSRKAINNTVVIIELTNSTGLKEVYKVYSNDNGTATFNFVSWGDRCTDMKMLYCPFCNPNSSSCGFAECLSYARIHNGTAYYSNVPDSIASISDIPAGPGSGAAPPALNPNLYFPAIKIAAYCPPPPPLNATPALCLPLLIIFALLSGALYLTGRNPFAGFNIGGARVGRHIRYQARGRGFSFSAMAVVNFAQGMKDLGTLAFGSKESKDQIHKREATAAETRFIGGQLVQIKRAVGLTPFRWGGAMRVATASARRGKGTMKNLERRTKNFEAIMGGRSSGGGGITTQDVGGKLQTGVGGGGPVSIVRGSEIFKGSFFSKEGGFGLGNLGRLVGFLIGNSTLCQAIDGITSLWGGRPLAEKWLVSHQARAYSDGLAREDIMALGVESGRGYVIPSLAPRTREDGTTVVVIQAMNSVEGQQGPVTLVFAADGKTVISATFEMEGLGNVTARMANGQLVFERPSLDKNGRPVMERIDGEANVARLTAAYTAAIPQSLGVGREAPAFLGDCTRHFSDVTGITSSISNSTSIEREAQHSRTEDSINGDDAAKARVRARADAEAEAVLKTATGSSAEALLQGVEPPNEKTSGAVHAVRETADAHRDAASTIQGAVGSEVPGDNEPAARALLNLYRSGSLEHLAGMNADDIKADVIRAMTTERLNQPGVVPKGTTDVQMARTVETVRAQVESSVGGINFEGIAAGFRRADSDFREHLRGEGFSTDTISQLRGASTAQLERIDSTSRLVDNPVALLQRDPERSSLPVAVRANLDTLDQIDSLSARNGLILQNLQAGILNSEVMEKSRQFNQQYPEFFTASAFSDTLHDLTTRSRGPPTDSDTLAARQQLQALVSSPGFNDALEGLDQSARAARQEAFMPAPQGAGTVPGSSDTEVIRREEIIARDRAHSLTVAGDFDAAAGVARERYEYYSGAGNSGAAEVWGNTLNQISSIRDGFNSRLQEERSQGGRMDADGAIQKNVFTTQQQHAADVLPYTTFPITVQEAGNPSALASRTDMEVYGQYAQTRDINRQLESTVSSGNYSAAADICTSQIDRYRQMGDERTALAYEVALTNIHGLRRGEYFDRNWFNGVSLEEQLAAEREAQTRILQDVGARPVRMEEDGKPIYGAIVGTPSSLSTRTASGINENREQGVAKQERGGLQMTEGI